MSGFSNRDYYEMGRVYLLSNERLRAACTMCERVSVPRLRAQGILNPAVPNTQNSTSHCRRNMAGSKTQQGEDARKTTCQTLLSYFALWVNSQSPAFGWAPSS
ncbi:uncharacterized protein LOC128198149 [Bicyclus anynana]|uniref:Uncharacterized protein LOC128198149 n=1 Tax=Bicyclus anynana TaxID=110368 RepID=A0ABM3LFU7_BICAN|nr:uncharacterized protein LOC128198149 [Bicyclus anynana]